MAAAAAVRCRHALLHSRWTSLAVDAVLLLNAAAVVAEVELLAREDLGPLGALEYASAPLFDAILLLELALKVWCLGGRWLARPAHAFAAVATLASFATDAWGWYTPETIDMALRVALIVRTLRLLRLLGSVGRLNAVFSHIGRILPALSSLFGVAWALASFYAQLGVTLFGGRLSSERWAQEHPDAPPDYYLCNFNDFGSALVTLFELLVVNNWHVVMQDVVDVTSDWARVYFISWYLLAVVILTNLIVAHILDGFFVATGGGGGGALEPLEAASALLPAADDGPPLTPNRGAVLESTSTARREELESWRSSGLGEEPQSI